MSFFSNEARNRRFPPQDFFTAERLEMGKAIYKNDKHKVESLLKQGVDVNQLSANQDGFTYLMYAVFLENRFEIAKLLLEHHADPNLVSHIYFPTTKDHDFYLPLSSVAQDMPIEYMQLLLQYGADPNYAYRDEKGEVASPRVLYALHRAVSSAYMLYGWSREDYINDVKARVDLLLAYGADINSQDSLGNSVGDHATSNPEIILYLIDKGADHRLFGERTLRGYKRRAKIGYHFDWTEQELMRRLTALGYKGEE